MQTLKKVIIIPENHHLKLDVTLPNSFPTGEVEVILVIASNLPPKPTNSNLLSLAGKLKKSINFSGNPLTLQKKLRDEWQS